MVPGKPRTGDDVPPARTSRNTAPPYEAGARVSVVGERLLDFPNSSCNSASRGSLRGSGSTERLRYAGQKARVRGVEGENDLIPVNPLKTRGPSLHPEPRPGTSNCVRRTLAPCQRRVNAPCDLNRVDPRRSDVVAPPARAFREESARGCAGSAEKIAIPRIRGAS